MKNLTLLMDFYELTMSNGFLEAEMKDTIGVFDLYFRKNPDSASFSICCGLNSIIEYIQNLHFSKEDIEFIKGKNLFNEKFITFLEKFKFTCDLYAVPEGSVVFPNEPLITVRGPIWQAVLLETMLLLSINHQSLIATKANRIVRASQNKTVLEFGARRAQGPDAANLGARAAYIAGVDKTSNTLADLNFNVPSSGTMAHSWIMAFETEYKAFKKYAEIYPDSTVLLVDTFNTLKSGIPNAIKVFNEVLKPLGKRPLGIRLDSGDLSYLSKKARKMLDDSGYKDCKIVASNSLDEHKIKDILRQGAEIDIFGVGENLITSKSNPVFGGVYKLVQIEQNQKIIPKIKVSENVEKVTTPGFKQVFRIYDKNTGHAIVDLIALRDENIDDKNDLEVFHPVYTWKRMIIEKNTYYIKPLMKQIYEKGKLVYKVPEIDEIRTHCKKDMESLWQEYQRFDNPQIYKVDLTQNLWDLKQKLLFEATSK